MTLLFATSFVAKGQAIQRYNSFKYTVNQGLKQSTMADLNFDGNNFCWLSFPNGIQKFDGKVFIDIPIQEGLPDNKWVYFFRCQNGDLLISHSFGISKYNIRNNRFQLIYSSISTVMRPARFIGEDEDLFYCYTEQGTIIGFSCSTYEKMCEIPTGIPGYGISTEFSPWISQNIVDHHVVLQVNNKLYRINLKEKKLDGPGVSIPGIYSYFLWMENKDQVMYWRYNKDNILELERYDFKNAMAQPLRGKSALSAIALRSKIYDWQGKIISSSDNHLYQTDRNYNTIYHELVDFQNKPVAGNSAIVKIIEDNNGNLFLQTINDGFRKIIRNAYPVKYYGKESQDENYCLSILPDKDENRILVGTYGSGVFIYDTLQRLIRQFKTLPGDTKGMAVNAILKKPNGDYLISAHGDKMYLLNNSLTSITALPVRPMENKKFATIGYFANVISQNDNEAVIKSQYNFYKINFRNNEVREYESDCRADMSGVLFRGNIVTHFEEHFSLLDTATFKQVKRFPFKGTGAVRCYLPVGSNQLYVGSNNGIYIVDSNFRVLTHLDKNSGLPDECIYAMHVDENGTIWCSTNKGLSRIRQHKNILQLTKEDGLQENEFNTGVVAQSRDGELFFGGVNGASSFFPASIGAVEDKVNILFTGIRINNEDRFRDTAVWNISALELGYDQNALAFDFIAAAADNPDQYVYQYMMEGVDKEWSLNNNLQTVHYYLPPGKYVFKVYASRVFNNEAKAMKEIAIRIHPPFWKAWWFLSGVILFFVLALAYGINRFNRNKYHRRVAALEGEHQLQVERERISRDLHDNIGAYASTVLYKTELLQTEALPGERTQLIRDLRFASKDIITSLRETIWALKKEEYSAQECVLRIRNFIQPFINYYPNIHFSVDGDAAPGMVLHYTKALNLVRIVQEAVSNAIKHAGASSVNIQSSVQDNKWKLVVTDNGKGFEYEGVDQLQQGNGINNMKERAKDGGFDLSISSSPGAGTSITIIV